MYMIKYYVLITTNWSVTHNLHAFAVFSNGFKTDTNIIALSHIIYYVA